MAAPFHTTECLSLDPAEAVVYVPLAVPALANKVLSHVACGSYGTAALTQDGQLVNTLFFYPDFL